MEDVLLGWEAASEPDSSQGSDFRKSVRVGPKTLTCHHPKECTHTALACVPALSSCHLGTFLGAVCRGSSKGLGRVDIVIVRLSFRLCSLDFEASRGISFSIFPPPWGKMRCPHKAMAQGPCRRACTNTLLSNDLICNEAKCWCSSSWHRMPGEVTKLLYVPLALAAMVNSPAAFMQMPVNTLWWLCQEAVWQAV